MSRGRIRCNSIAAIRLRPFADDDADAICRILDATYGYDPWVRSIHGRSHGPAVDRPQFFSRTLVAEADGDVVGVGTITHGQRHLRRSLLAIEVAPANRRRGIGTMLLEELRSFTQRPLCARGRFVDEAAIAFLRRHEFALLDRSWGGRFEPASVVAQLPTPTLGLPPTLDEAAMFFERWYADVHPFDPPTPWPLERARAAFCGDVVVADSLVGVRERDRLIGAANLIRTPGYDPGDELYLIWIGTREGVRQAATTLVAACVHFALKADRAIRLEVNEANAEVCAALDQVGLLGEPELGIFAEDGGG